MMNYREEMTPRERLIAAIRREEVDRVPFSPFLAYWWDFAPEDIRKKGQFTFMKELGVDPLLRGHLQCFTCQDILGLEWEDRSGVPDFPGCSIRYNEKGRYRHVQFETPVGSLEMEHTFAEAARTWMITGHPVKSREDYKTLLYLVENLSIEADYAPAEMVLQEIGEDGLLVGLVSPFVKTPFQSLVEHFVGTVQLAYDYFDFPELIEEVCEVMGEKARQSVEISCQSPVDAFISWEDSSTLNVSPKQFDKLIAEEYRLWGEIIHKEGKLLLHHACGHIKDLLPSIARERVDAVESVSPPPTGNTHIWEAQEALAPAGTSVIGGIDPVLFQELSIPELRVHVRELLERCDKRGFVLSNSDSCPPEVTLEAFKAVVEEVHLL